MAVLVGILLLVMLLFLLLYASGRTKWSLDQTIQYMVGTLVVLGVIAGSLAMLFGLIWHFYHRHRDRRRGNTRGPSHAG